MRCELTQIQIQMLKLIAAGLSTNEIADARKIAVKTVKYHITVLNRKLKTRNRPQLALWWFRNSKYFVEVKKRNKKSVYTTPPKNIPEVPKNMLELPVGKYQIITLVGA